MPDKQVVGITQQTDFQARPEVNTLMAILGGRAYGNVDLAGSIALMPGPELTISGGVIDIDRDEGRRTAAVGNIIIDTEADAASDDLDTINGGHEGQILVLGAANDARTVVVKDGTGNIHSQADFSLDHTSDTMVVIKRGSNWDELTRSDNG